MVFNFFSGDDTGTDIMMIHNNIHANYSPVINLLAFCIPTDSEGILPVNSFYDKSCSQITTDFEDGTLLKLERRAAGLPQFIHVARCLSDNPDKDVTGTFGKRSG